MIDPLQLESQDFFFYFSNLPNTFDWKLFSWNLTIQNTQVQLTCIEEHPCSEGDYLEEGRESTLFYWRIKLYYVIHVHSYIKYWRDWVLVLIFLHVKFHKYK